MTAVKILFLRIGPVRLGFVLRRLGLVRSAKSHERTPTPEPASCVFADGFTWPGNLATGDCLQIKALTGFVEILFDNSSGETYLSRESNRKWQLS